MKSKKPPPSFLFSEKLLLSSLEGACIAILGPSLGFVARRLRGEDSRDQVRSNTALIILERQREKTAERARDSLFRRFPFDPIESTIL